jgi:hypothetical protein
VSILSRFITPPMSTETTFEMCSCYLEESSSVTLKVETFRLCRLASLTLTLGNKSE